MTRPYAFALALAALSTAPLSAQIAFGGRPYGTRTDGGGLAPAAVVHLPNVDVDALFAEDAARSASRMKGPYRFGYTHHVQYGLANSGTWTDLPNGDRVWRITLVCDGAIGINFAFSDYQVPAGARVFVYNAAGEVRGAFTAESNPGSTQLGVAPIPGERITVEYIEPTDVRGQGRLLIGDVTHEYRDAFGGEASKGFGESGSCNVNTICPDGDGWRDQIRAVARIINGGDWCTGQLINDCASDGTPYFLTANHCVSGESNFGSWVFQFNWESPTCSPTTNAPTTHTVSGATLLVHNSVSDFALLRLNSTPPADYHPFYGGWDKSGDTPSTQTCIHHPSGDIKKISHDNDPAGSATENFGNGNAQCWWIHQWDTGTTEGGSSGSGLWDQDHHLIGQLYGGAAWCLSSVDDYFGKFSVSYPYLEQYLGTCGDVLEGYDPEGTGISGPAGAPAAVLTTFPNPANALLTVVLPDGGAGADLRVFDTTGRLVHAEHVATGALRTELSTAGLDEGVYVLEAVVNGTRYTDRVVVKH